MKKWVVFVAAFAAMAVLACGNGSGPANDDGQPLDTPTQDLGTPDTNDRDTFEPVDTGVDTAEPEDTSIAVDTAQPDINVQVDEGQPLDTAVGCPEGATTGSTCWEAGSCAVLCGDTAFQDTCMASAEQAVKDAYAAFATCLAGTECQKVFEGEQISDCVNDACATQVEGCFVGDKECRDMWECRKDCDAADPACPMRCFASGTAVAQDTWVAYKDCIMAVECSTEDVMENGWPTFNCEQNARDFCTIPYQACFPPT